MNMHQRISLARTEAGFNKSQLARTLNVTPTSCSSWELPPDNRNSSRPGVDNLGRLAMILNVRFEWLATGRGPKESTNTAHSEMESDTPEAALLLGIYRALPAHQRTTVLDFVRLVAEDSNAAEAQQSSRRGRDQAKTAFTERSRPQ